jgi:translation initiation factor eIF-2B subunit epsilon
MQRFRPITIERPKVLLPLVNVPMLEYTLEWLAMNKVEEASVNFCMSRMTLVPGIKSIRFALSR